MAKKKTVQKKIEPKIELKVEPKKYQKPEKMPAGVDPYAWRADQAKKRERQRLQEQ